MLLRLAISLTEKSMRSAIATIAALLFLHGASQAATAPEDTLLVPGERVEEGDARHDCSRG